VRAHDSGDKHNLQTTISNAWPVHTLHRCIVIDIAVLSATRLPLFSNLYRTLFDFFSRII
jgi:hypothetical protein